jgi:hypothetical protein
MNAEVKLHRLLVVGGISRAAERDRPDGRRLAGDRWRARR